jgi:arsenate reductase (thioredoxin)
MYRILLLCKNNAVLSPIAEGYCKSLTGPDTEIYSAGVEKEKIDPLVIKMMNDEGIDLSNHKPQSVHNLKHLEFDYILTFDSESEAESHHFPSKTVKYHYDFDKMLHENDIKENKSEVYNNVRDKIKKSVKSFVKEHLTKD